MTTLLNHLFPLHLVLTVTTTAWAWIATHALGHHKAKTALLPPAVSELLDNHPLFAELVQIATAIAGYVNLTPEQRQQAAASFFTGKLKERGIELPDHELNLLIELVYHQVAQHNPAAIRPGPESL